MENSLIATMSQREFRLLSEFISTNCGIKMPPAKKAMLEARLRKRLKHYGMSSFHEYCNYLFSIQGIQNELVHMIDVVTTNKTDFFREPIHFEYLLQKVLPSMIKTNGAGFAKKFSAWSVGCSTGEEVYSMAILLKEEGLLAKPTHGDIIRFAPPLVINKEEIDFALQTIRKGLKKFN